MVTESQFVKYALKENDTLTSVANDFDVSIEYLILVHNLHVENYDKIKNRLNFPEHLKEIYIHQDTAAAFVQKKNKERTKNNPDLIYKHILAEKKYQVLYSFLDGDEETNLSFQTSITALKKSSNQQGFIVEINRTEPTLINDASPDLVIDELAVETYGKSFKINDDDKPIIFKLLIYAIRDHENAFKLGLDINKGILLTGPIGCGKTHL